MRIVREAGDELSPEAGQAIAKIWTDEDVREYYHQVSSFAQLPSCAP